MGNLPSISEHLLIGHEQFSGEGAAMSHYQPALQAAGVRGYQPHEGDLGRTAKLTECCEHQLRVLCHSGASYTLEGIFGG